MCERVDLGGGNFAMICGTRHKKKYCACGRPADFECDWKVPAKRSGTCDAPICVQHALGVGQNKHLCPLHQRAYEAWKKRRGAAIEPGEPQQMNLLEEREHGKTAEGNQGNQGSPTR